MNNSASAIYYWGGSCVCGGGGYLTGMNIKFSQIKETFFEKKHIFFKWFLKKKVIFCSKPIEKHMLFSKKKLIIFYRKKKHMFFNGFWKKKWKTTNVFQWLLIQKYFDKKILKQSSNFKKPKENFLNKTLKNYLRNFP